MGTIRTLYVTFSKYRWHILTLAVLGFVSAILEGIGINAVIPLLSFFMGDGPHAPDLISQTIRSLFAIFSIPFSFRYLLGFILVLFILRAFVLAIFGYVKGWISIDYLCEESEDMLSHTLRASWPFLLKQKLGNLHNTLIRDIQRSMALLEGFAQVMQSFGGFLMYFLVAINISPTITLYTLGGGAGLFLVARPLLRRSRIAANEAISYEKAFSQFLSEHVIGMKSVKAAGAERRALVSGYGILRSLRALSLRLVLIRAGSGSLFQPFSLIFIIVIFAISYSSPSFSIISFAATLYLIQKIFTYLESGQVALHNVVELVPYATNLSTFKAQLRNNREEVKEGKARFSFERDLTFQNVSFAYNNGSETTTLTDVSFTINRGETVGLIGPSGAGKTTVADLLLRLFEPTGGQILLDDVPTADIGVSEWRGHIGYVSQDIFLLNDTVAENIRFYDKHLTQKDIETAAKQANIYDFVMSLPNGFNTVVGDRGAFLSGGQRQRVVLARALARKPQLLILDEATSALDTESERLIQESIRALHGDVTVFVIAHRLSTIESVDTLMVLEEGRVTEIGTPQELAQNPDSYFAKYHEKPKKE
jgi:ABC-type multidrug transport system fused ATPase/permease subunit